ncbi:hypothetical protein J2Z42_001389 [Clostridium algifaecis]|uniref:DUF6575 domain-containing protein n=2 Tax=Clostridium algifaecis TaxID=1472040 RepID=A0ABS4KRR1_9CLOT|nr:hypothetical protein [Clostridium algifaecis]
MNVDLLGRLYIKKVFVYYDEPLMFSCYNKFNQLFLANCIDEDDEKKMWILLPVSQYKLNLAEKNEISVRSLFIDPEEPFLWKLEQNIDSLMAKASQIKPEILTDDELPTEDAYFNIEIEDKCMPKNNNTIIEDAIDEERTIFDLSLEVEDNHSHEISPDILGNTLSNLYELIHSVDKENSDDDELYVAGFYAASFGVRLKSKNRADLLGEIKVHKKIETIMDLLECKNDVEKLTKMFNSLNSKVVKKYKNLLNTLSKGKIGIKTYVASPNRRYKEAIISSNEISSSLNTLEMECTTIINNYEITGELVGVNIENNTFFFKDKNDKKFKGKISENINVDIFTIPFYTKIKIEEKISTYKFSNKKTTTFTLLEIES